MSHMGSIASILTCPRYVRLAGNSGNVDWLLNGSTLGVIHLVYAQAADRGVDGADVALNRIGHGREFREHQPRVIDRGPAWRAFRADSSGMRSPVPHDPNTTSVMFTDGSAPPGGPREIANSRFPAAGLAPPTGASTIRLGDVATAVAVPGVA